MSPAGQGRILWHGTTRRKAEAILRDGPNPNYREPGGVEKAEGLSTAPPHGPYDSGDPRSVAASKAALFPDEGGPAILEIVVPEEIVVLSVDLITEIRFVSRGGLEELCAVWTTLSKRIL
jgi:hypothetical protein